MAIQNVVESTENKVLPTDGRLMLCLEGFVNEDGEFKLQGQM